MLRSLPTPLLLAAVLVVGAVDLIVTAPLAHGEDEAVVETPKPLEIPSTAFLTGPVVSEADLDGVIAVVGRDGDGKATMVLKNEGSKERHVEIGVEVWATEGMMLSRMGPQSRLQKTQLVKQLVPAGKEVSVKLDLELPESMEPTNVNRVPEGQVDMLAFSTTELVLNFGENLNLEPTVVGWDDRPRLRLPDVRALDLGEDLALIELE